MTITVKIISNVITLTYKVESFLKSLNEDFKILPILLSLRYLSKIFNFNGVKLLPQFCSSIIVALNSFIICMTKLLDPDWLRSVQLFH